jgi:hypothetical protein
VSLHAKMKASVLTGVGRLIACTWLISGSYLALLVLIMETRRVVGRYETCG